RPSATTMIKPSGRSSMTLSRRSLLKSAAAVGALTASAEVFAPAIAQNKPVRIGILAPRSGIAAAPGENGIRATQWAVERLNAGGGIAGRKVELVIEEESSPKDTIERFGKLVQQEKVDCVQGIISTVSLDRKSTRLNSSHVAISYAVFCLKKKKDDKETALADVRDSD